MMQANALEKELEQDSQYVYSHLMWQYIPAKVIHATTHKQHNYLTINKGKRDGIEVDMGVLSHDGVVGIVTAVSEKYALVVPTIHTEMNLSCRLKKNNCVGRTQWMGRNCQEVALKDISRHISVEEGDTVVTSGLTSIFPEGIAVGIVTATALHEGDNYHQTTLQLTTDYQSIKYVQVIHNLSHNENDSILWSGLKK
jgi:rod shape-determining protein MreC